MSSQCSDAPSAEGEGLGEGREGKVEPIEESSGSLLSSETRSVC